MIKVLWITNNLLPDICDYLGIGQIVKTGWLHSAANQIKIDVELHVASTYNGKELSQKEINGINYILIPSSSDKREYNSELNNYWKKIKETIMPDVVHIHGTEYPLGLSYIKAIGAENVVVSIQGLISECAKYYNFGISNIKIIRYTTLRDILKNCTLWANKRRFSNQGKYEIEYIKTARNFIGRTNWDKSQIKAYNPEANYFFNNETLRDSFYDSQWDIKAVDRHSIFFSQSTYPLKGLHILLKAMPIVLRKYPDAKVYIAGYDIIKVCRESRIGCLKSTTYGNLIFNLIKKLNLSKNIKFLGSLTEVEMRDQYLKANLYVNSSGIENSSNSLGEAQILGTPVIASFVGGTDSMVMQDLTGLLYPSDDYVRLADSIIRIFDDDNLAVKLSGQEQKEAHKRHHKINNKEQLLAIYKVIMENS